MRGNYDGPLSHDGAGLNSRRNPIELPSQWIGQMGEQSVSLKDRLSR
jgi:hypothetical protein